MDRYTLSYEGRARFRRMKTRLNSNTLAKTEGYEILNYLYEHGATTVEEIENYTGLPRSQVINQLLTFVNHELVEELAEP